MKRSINKLMLGFAFAAVAALNIVSVSAQDATPAATPEDPAVAAAKAAAYQTFLGCYKAKNGVDGAAIDACLVTGNDYMTKYGTPPDDFNKFVGTQVTNLKTKKEALPYLAAQERFYKAFGAKDTKAMWDTGKQLLALEKNPALKLDLTLALATLGYDRAFSATPDLSTAPEAISFAKSALSMIDSGTSSSPDRLNQKNEKVPALWGEAGTYGYGTKANAQAWMNFAVGRLVIVSNTDKTKSFATYKEAAPYFYKSLKYESPEIKKSAIPFQNIGAYYREELNAKVDEYDVKKCQTVAEDSPDLAACKTILGLQLAYAERGADAYARALDAAKKDSTSTQAYKDALQKSATEFYNARFPKKPEGANDFIAKAVNQTLPDPSVAVTPVPEEVVAPATTTGAPTAGTTSPAAPAVKPATNVTTPAAKPATTPAKPATAPAKPASSGAKVSTVPVKKKAVR
jgi:hypothetical protein